jgi:hypothetical protein
MSVANEKAMELGFHGYLDYLNNSFYWFNLKRQVLKDVCAGCNGRRYTKNIKWMELHHLTYDRLGAELPEDVCTLCSWCHTQVSNMVWKGECEVEDTLWILRKKHLGIATQMAFNFDSDRCNQPDSVFTSLKKAA